MSVLSNSESLQIRLSEALKRIRTLESECAVLRNRADNAGNNAEALQERCNALMEACQAVEDWWLTQGMQESKWGAPACIFHVRAALAQCQEER